MKRSRVNALSSFFFAKITCAIMRKHWFFEYILRRNLIMAKKEKKAKKEKEKKQNKFKNLIVKHKDEIVVTLGTLADPLLGITLLVPNYVADKVSEHKQAVKLKKELDESDKECEKILAEAKKEADGEAITTA
jgi:hypothetical protein